MSFIFFYALFTTCPEFAGAGAGAFLKDARKIELILKPDIAPDAGDRHAGGTEQQLGLACEWSWHDQVDIAREGNSKGKRLAQWVASAGYQMSEVLAFGDNYNDLSMLETVGLGVAMGNADEAIKARAGRVIGTNLEPGIAETIYREVL